MPSLVAHTSPLSKLLLLLLLLVLVQQLCVTATPLTASSPTKDNSVKVSLPQSLDPASVTNSSASSLSTNTNFSARQDRFAPVSDEDIVSSVASSPAHSPIPTAKNGGSKPRPETHVGGKNGRRNCEEDRDEDDFHTDDDKNREFTWQTFVIIVITILIILSNCAIIMVVTWTEAFSNFNKIFIYSLALADLLIGLFITPYSIFFSVYQKKIFKGDVFCSVEAYMFTTLISAKMYSLTWLNVDQYVAVRKPERYNSMMTPARSLCWICFSWVVVISFCCPPLFSAVTTNQSGNCNSEPSTSIYDGASYICMIDTKQQIAYILTAGVLVCTPSMVTTVITGAYLFTKSFKKQIQFYEKVFVDLCTRPWNYHITFTMSVVFFGVWFPFTCIYIIQYFLNVEMDSNLLFVFCWLGISTGFSQFIVLFFMSPDFRRALRELIRFPEFCRQTSGVPEGVASGPGIEARDYAPPAYLTFFEKYTSQDVEDFNTSPSPRSLSKGTGERRKQSQRSGTQGSGSTSTSSIPYVDALGSITGIQHRGVYNMGTPAHV